MSLAGNKSNIIFIILVVLMGGLTIGKRMIIEKLGISLQKQPIELRNPLDDLDLEDGSDYVITSKKRIENKDIEDELGTTNYIMWELNDSSLPETSPVHSCFLFITYYTGINDRIPHVPEECYFGAGNTVKRYIDAYANIPAADDAERDVKYRMIEFIGQSQSVWYGSKPFYVSYMLNVNGNYAANRTEARNIMATNLFGKYSYFAKIEWRFSGKSLPPDNEQVQAASKKLLGVLLPKLEANHWPEID